MTTTPALFFRWDGHAMVPYGRFAWQAEKSFKPGLTYRLTSADEASSQTRRHYFAAVREAWINLPEHTAGEFPTPEHLRKWALIRTGFCNKQTWVVPTRQEAERMATAMEQVNEAFAIVTVKGCTVTRYTAKSQAGGKMGRREFQKSKQAVLDYLAAMIETTPEALAEAGKAA
jgi:hypothetical protein